MSLLIFIAEAPPTFAFTSKGSASRGQYKMSLLIFIGRGAAYLHAFIKVS